MQKKIMVYFDLYSSQPIGSSKFHGGGEYIKTVYKQLVKGYLDKCEIVAYYDFEAFIDEWMIKLNTDHRIKTVDVKNIQGIEKILQENASSIDILFLGLPNAYTKISLPKDVYKIGVIHGLRYAEMPIDRYSHLYAEGKEWLKFRIKQMAPGLFTSRAIKVYEDVYNMLDEVLVDSDHTSYALSAWMGIDIGDKVHVCYSPLRGSITMDMQTKREKKYGRYFFMISADRWEKNSYRALLAFEDLFEKGMLKEHKVVICGKLSKKVKGVIKHLEKYVFKGYVSIEELEGLYYDCDVFVYPTLNEGFGYPPMEAMKYGRTCIVSAVCSLPELCGDKVYWVNPKDVKEIENRLLWAAENKKNEAEVIARYQKIYARQKEDLERVCRLIVEKGSTR